MTLQSGDGPADGAEIAGMTGLEQLRAMIAGRLPAAPIGRTMGFRLIEVEEGKAAFEGTPGPGLLNPLGSVHGGWALTLIDSATGCAVHATLPAGEAMRGSRPRPISSGRSPPTAAACAARAKW